MKVALMVAAVVASLFEARGVAPSGAVQKPDRRGPYVSPPPPRIYDPRPGPFIVRLGDRGEVSEDYREVIANAVQAWSGPKLQAFSICFRSPDENVDWTAAFKALDAVSRELKVQGAQIVVMPSGRLCDPSTQRPAWKGPLVEIMGVIRV